MKKIYLLAVTAIMFVSCAKKMVNPYSTSEVISHKTQGLVTLRGVSDEFDDNRLKARLDTRQQNQQQAALEDAHRKAIEQLFYMGFPGTDFKSPIITKGKSIESERKVFFDNFWKNGYKQFVTESKVQYYPCAQVKNRCTKAVSEFTLNYNMLRKELEKNKVINKIGF